LVEYALTRRGRFGARLVIDTAGYESLHTLSLAGRMYDLLCPPTSSSHGLATAVAEMLKDDTQRIAPQVRLYSAFASGTCLAVLLALPRNLLPTDGPIMTEDRVKEAEAFAQRMLACGLDLATSVIRLSAAAKS
jgi:hypothetical protein